MSGLSRLLRLPVSAYRRLCDSAIYPGRLKSAGVNCGDDLILLGMPDVRMRNGGTISLGRHVHLLSRPDANPLRLAQPCTLALLADGAKIVIGDDVAMSGSVLCAAKEISVGARTLLGANCRIVDTDFHPLEAEMRRCDRAAGAGCAPVNIGADCFVGMGALILKGTVLGDGCVVGAGAVVSGKFEPNTLIAGNPARAVRNLLEDRS